MLLLDRVRRASGRPVAIANAHHENKGGDISGAFEAEFDTVVQVKSSGTDGTSLFFRKSRWSSKIHRARVELSWIVASEGFAVTKSDFDASTPAAARDAEEAGVLEWLTEYVVEQHQQTGHGVAKEKAASAYHEAHDNHGRNLARRVIERQISLAATYLEDGGSGERSHTLATGPGEVRNGVYLYPAWLVPSPLAATSNGEGGEAGLTLDSTDPLATSPPPIEEAAAGEEYGEGGDDDAGGWVDPPLLDDPGDRLDQHGHAQRLAFLDTLDLVEEPAT